MMLTDSNTDHKKTPRHLSANHFQDATSGLLGQFLATVTEYVIAFIVVVECNSLFAWSTDNDSGDVGQALLYMAAILTWALIVFYLLKEKNRLLLILRSILPIMVLLGLFLLLFYVLNVRHVDDSRKVLYYLQTLVVCLPTLVVFFRVKCYRSEELDFFKKHADVVVVLATISVLIYCAYLFNPQIIHGEIIRTRWSGTGEIRELKSYLNLCTVSPTEGTAFFGVRIPRNYGFFPESPMFEIPLIMALYTELFIKKRTSCFRCAVLCVAIITSQATMGLIIAILGISFKLLQRLGSKKRLIIGITIAAVAVVCLVLLVRKSTGLGSGSFATHVDDFRVSLKAFSQRPLIGWGFDDNQYIQQYMSADRLEHNSGLSNSIAVILATGGVALGLFCMLPLAICASRVLYKEQRNLGLWSFGNCLLYIFVIFHYRLSLLVMIAFGYALLNIDVNVKQHSMRISIWSCERALKSANENKRAPFFDAITIVLVALWAILLCLSGAFWDVVYSFMKSNQLLFNASAWKFFFFIIAAIYGAVCFRFYLESDETTEKMSHLMRFVRWVVYSLAFFLLYPLLYSALRTILEWRNTCEEVTLSTFVALLYFGLLIFVEIPASHMERGTTGDRGKTIASASCVCALVIAGLCIVVTHAVRAEIGGIQDEAKLINVLCTASQGNVYADVKPLVYHTLCPGVSLTSGRGETHVEEENATMIVDHILDMRKLYNAGFFSAEMSAEHILYSNDVSVKRKLEDLGYEVSYYYAYARPINMQTMAVLNDLELTEDNAVILNGVEHSLVHGPYAGLEKGSYTLSYTINLINAPENASQKIATLHVSAKAGKETIVEKPLYASDFDSNQPIEARALFVTEQRDGVEYQINVEEGVTLSVLRGQVVETPKLITREQLNGRLQLVREEYFDLFGTPHLNEEGYAAIGFAYNASGFESERSFYDAEENLVVTSEGYACVTKETEGTGLVTRKSYFDADLKPVMLPYHYASVDIEYNSKRQVVREEYYDTRGHPVKIRFGYAAIERDYDTAGNETVQRVYDEAGNPVLGTGGWAEIHRDYDADKHLVREEFYGIDEKPIDIRTGQTINEYAYDTAGNRTDAFYHDAQGRPTLISNGYAGIHNDFNGARQVSREWYYDTDGKMMVRAEGYSIVEHIYDDEGNANVLIFLDADGKPTMLTDGYVEVHRTYNAKRQVTREEFCDENGNPCTRTGGYHAVEYAYDAAGDTIERRYLDQKSELVNNANGFAVEQNEYDVYGNTTKTIHYNKEMQVVE